MRETDSPRVPQSKRKWVLGAAFLLALSVGAGIAVRRYRSGPLAVARGFLGGCRTRDYAALRSLFDSSYQTVFPPEYSRALLERLHEAVPRAYQITMAGRPNTFGLVDNWHRYHVRVQFEEPPEARQDHKSFGITLVQEQNGVWRIEFEPTYLSLLRSLYDAAGEQYFRRTLWEMAGPRSRSLWVWRPG